jgi:putative ABC transport system substrate-binding protein
MHFGQLERRAFLSLLGGAVTYQRSAHAQPSNKLPTIGFIGSGSTSTQGQAVTRFALRLRDLGWVEGRTVAIEYRWIEGRNERAVEITAEFVREGRYHCDGGHAGDGGGKARDVRYPDYLLSGK